MFGFTLILIYLAALIACSILSGELGRRRRRREYDARRHGRYQALRWQISARRDWL